MNWRKWLVRGLVYSLLGGMVAAALLYQLWTNPSATRRQVLGQLDKVFIGAHVSLESARLRLLGGISFTDLRMTRRESLDSADFLYVPDGVIYHDKERLANGDLGIRKIELHRVRIRVVRDREGRWNVAKLLAPPNLNERVPMLVFQQATLVFEDQTTQHVGPLLEIKDVNLTVINDPLPTLNFDGGGQSDVAGPVHVSGKLQRASGDVTLELEAPALPVNPALIERLAAFAPAAATHVQTLRGEGRIQVKLGYHSGQTQPLTYDATLSLAKGSFSHVRVPWPLQDVEASARLVDGHVPSVHLAARSGPSRFEATAKDLAIPPNYSPSDDGSVMTDLVRELDLRLEHIYVDDKIQAYLPENLKSLEQDYKPTGYLSLTHTFRKEESGRWRKTLQLTPEDMQATYRLFPYPVERITGVVDVEYENEIQPLVKLDLLGHSRERAVTLKGTAQLAKSNSTLELDIAAQQVPLDRKLLDALPETCQKLVKQFLPEKSRKTGSDFRAMGAADFKVALRRKRGSPDLDKSFFITFHDAALRYDVFPYPLENVSGLLEIHPDHWEAKEFRGSHNNGTISFSGHSESLAGRASVTERPERVHVQLHGRQIKLDDPDFLAALEPRKALQQTWNTLKMAGTMNFDAEVLDVPGQEKAIDIGVSIDGCQMKPEFFQYALNDVSGKFRYAKERVYLDEVKATHGDSVLTLKKGQIILKKLGGGEPGSGGFQARLDAVQGTPVVPDDDFLQALPDSLREGLKALKLHAPVYAGTALVVDVGPTPDPHPLIWWDGGVFLRDATLQTGVELSHIDGLITCCGMRKDRDMQLVGHLALDQATLLKQPLQNVQARFQMQPDSPSVLRIQDLTANVFGGAIGGEGRVELGAPLKYDLTLKALNVRLEQFGRHNFGKDADMEGPVCAGLHIMGEGRDLSGLKGHGRVFVRDARLYKLPPLLDLIKAFGLRMPDRTAFDQASATFSIDGPQVRVEQLDLVGNAISLRGQGTANLDGSNLNFDFNADWARLGQFLPDVLSEGPRALSDQLLKVKVRGRAGDVRFEQEFVPAVTGPVKRAFSGEKP